MTLIDVPDSAEIATMVKSFFLSTCLEPDMQLNPGLDGYDFHSLTAVVFPARFDAYISHANMMMAAHSKNSKYELNEQFAFHGTSAAYAKDIVRDGFDRSKNQMGIYGRGSNFSINAWYSSEGRFAKTEHGSGYTEKTILICRILTGDSYPVTNGSSHTTKQNLPTNTRSDNGTKYDSFTNGKESYQYPPEKSIFVLAEGSDNQVYPEFIVKLRKLR